MALVALVWAVRDDSPGVRAERVAPARRPPPVEREPVRATAPAASPPVFRAAVPLQVFVVDADGDRRWLGKTPGDAIPVPEGLLGVRVRRDGSLRAAVAAVRGQGVRALDLERVRPGDLALLAGLPELEWLVLDDGRLRSGELAQLAAVPRLRHLELGVHGLADHDFAYLAGLPALESLDLNGGRIGDGDLREIAMLPRLTELCVWRSDVTAAGMAQLGAARLRRLELGGYGFDPAALAGLAGHPTLARLEFWHEDDFDAGTIAHLRRLPALEKLDFEYCGEFTDEGMAQLATIAGLRSLTLHCTDATDAGMRHLARLSNLEHLSLGDPDITDAGMAEIARMTGLRELSLRDAGITERGLAALRGLPRLETLFLTNTKVTGAGLAVLPAGLRSLTAHGAAARGFDFTRFPHLEELNLYRADVDDAALASIGRLRGLTYLDLDGTHVTSAGLARFVGLDRLRTLSLRDTQVDDAGLAYLSKLSALEAVDLRGTKVTCGWRPTRAPRRP